MEREIREEHASILRTCCGLSEVDELPKQLVTEYWKLKRVFDRISERVTNNNLAQLCYKLGHWKPIEREVNPGVVLLWRRGKLNRDDVVLAKWRGGEKEARIKGISGGYVVVQFENDPDERKLAPEKVRVAELATA